MPLPCVSDTFAAMTLPLSCVSDAKTVPFALRTCSYRPGTPQCNASTNTMRPETAALLVRQKDTAFWFANPLASWAKTPPFPPWWSVGL